MKSTGLALLGLVLAVQSLLVAQGQTFYGGVPVTGQLMMKRTVNLSLMAQQSQFRLGATFSAGALKDTASKLIPLLSPPLVNAPKLSGIASKATAGPLRDLAINPGSPVFGFSALNHAQQKAANNGNQFNIEPPSQGLAVSPGFILEGVNNAIQVYSTAGVPLLAKVLSTNEVFGLAPAIDQTTGINGPFPTDIRVFFDQTISRWFILQRTWDNDAGGNNLPSSHIYLAVSQSNNPTAGYNIYEMDTTNNQNFFGCPCFSDYLQIGADQYGFYITANEYNAFFPRFVDATILAISKAGLGSGASTPTAFQFTLFPATGYEFAIQPATTPPGASYFTANGGVQFFVSSQSRFSSDNSLAVWAMTNTSTLLASNPDLKLVRTNISTLTYNFPDLADQKSGPLPYGSTLKPPGLLAYLDGSDSRVLSLCYAGGRLYLTLATQVTDDSGVGRVGGAYFILSPTLRSGLLAATVIRQGYLQVGGNHLLRPAIAVNPQGRGAIVFTLVGPGYYPSAAFLPIDAASTSSTLQIAAAGAGAEDGFSGYLDPGLQGVARWGDYSVAIAAADGSIWMATEYIPPSSGVEQKANWGTYVMRYVP